jgi:hypothetical protein
MSISVFYFLFKSSDKKHTKSIQCGFAVFEVEWQENRALFAEKFKLSW